VWAAGVTYLRSKAARMEESDFSATAYDRVYDADRPEIFFKALAEKVVPTGGVWAFGATQNGSVPEPELALVINSQWTHSRMHDRQRHELPRHRGREPPVSAASQGLRSLRARWVPWIRLGITEADAREWTVRSTIARGGASVFAGETRLGQHQAQLRGACRISLQVAVVSTWSRVADRHRHRAARRFHVATSTMSSKSRFAPIGVLAIPWSLFNLWLSILS
jgi:2-dehydro-3-deoxy-D-arabinonate dehydratase